MANRQTNDMWLKPLTGAGTTVGLLEVDATGASSVALTITTQVGSAGANEINARLQGGNDGSTWFDIVTSPTSVDVTGAGVKYITGAVSGFAMVRALFTRASGSTDTLISAAINTGL